MLGLRPTAHSSKTRKNEEDKMDTVVMLGYRPHDIAVPDLASWENTNPSCRRVPPMTVKGWGLYLS